jgi:two-component system response regulator YesN
LKTILLVDDEPWARQQIKNNFPLNLWGYQLVGEAVNGLEALELCEALQPDIALIDITMPVMDGITLLQQIRNRFPLIKCIMLTAHREFTYAQQALQEGAFGYVLKSPTHEEMRSTLDKAVIERDKEQRLEQHASSHQALVNNYQYPLRRDFFNLVLAGVLKYEDEMLERGHSIGMNLRGTAYSLIVCRMDRLSALQGSYTEKDQILLEFSMLEIVRESLVQGISQPFELFPLSFGRFAVLIKGDRSFDTDRNSYQAFIIHMYKTCSTPLKQYMKLTFAAGVSSPFASLELLRSEYDQSLKRLDFRFYQDTPQPVTAYGLAPFQDLPPRQWEELSEQYKMCMENFQEAQFTSYLQSVKNKLHTHKPLPEKTIAWLSALYTLLPPNSYTDLLKTWPKFSVASSLSDAANMLMDWTRLYHQQQAEPSGERTEITKTKSFIQDHLDQELSLEMISQHVQLSHSYLGYLFKKELGITVFDYITLQRIDLAKQYLLSGEYRNYELAVKVGFPNYSYFSSLFKKQTGISPNEFKALHRKKQL